MRGWHIGVAIVVLAVIAAAVALYYKPLTGARPGGEPVVAAPTATAEEGAETGAQTMMKKAVQYLKASQNEDGSWGEFQPGTGITGLVLHSMMVSPLGLTPENTPEIQKGIAFLLANAQDNGEINVPGAGLGNYRTSLSLLALTEAGREKYGDVISKGQAFIKGLQHNEDAGVDKGSPKFGGFGYGKRKRPDMSNTQWAIEALAETGLSKDDPAFKKALVFLHRVQNSSEVNDQEWAAVVNDGGAVYSPAALEDDPSDVISKAGQVEKDGFVGWRSYGMTYAMLKSYIYLGLDEDSPEVRMAWKWISDNWTVEVNPGMPEEQKLQGKFYYLATLAKTLHLLDKDVVKTSDGKVHNWASELVDHLAEIQNEDGSWVNPTDRWYEGDKSLVTAYVLRALAYAWPHLK